MDLTAFINPLKIIVFTALPKRHGVAFIKHTIVEKTVFNLKFNFYGIICK